MGCMKRVRWRCSGNQATQLLVKAFVVMLASSSPVRSGVSEPGQRMPVMNAKGQSTEPGQQMSAMSAGMNAMNAKVKQGFDGFKNNVKAEYTKDEAAVKQGFNNINAKLNEPKSKRIESEVEIGLIAGGSAAALTAAATGIAYSVAHHQEGTTTSTTSVMRTTVTTINVNETVRFRVKEGVKEELSERDPRAAIFWLAVVLFVVLGILVCLCAYSGTKEHFKCSESSEDDLGDPVSECLSSRELKDFKDPEASEYEEGIE